MYFNYGETESAYLSRADSRMRAVIDRVGHINRPVDTDLFSSVIHHIIGQQISTKAQATIWQRMQLLEGSIIVRNVPRQAKRVLDAAGIGRLISIQ